jgi:hypothetical protein
MSNDVTRSPLIFDTAGSTIYNPGGAAIKLVRWVGGTTAGHTVVIQDASGRVLWTAVATGDNYTEQSLLETVWPEGFKVPTLASGKVYVYIGQ